MSKELRETTLRTLGLGGVIDLFRRGRLPADGGELAERVFGGPTERGCLVISGANGIVGAGKTMQLGSRLEPFGVPVVALDLPGAPDGIGSKYPGLERTFGRQRAGRIMANIQRLSYDGQSLPADLQRLRPRFLLEAVPEILDLKKAHYRLFQETFPGIEIRSVTSGFPSSELGVGIAHPAFPHEINKIWEIVEPEPSDITHLLWALGLIPVPVSDHWSFVLDVLFCGLTLAGLRYHRAVNMPFWKIDKFIRKHLGPNPFRAHDAIGAKGADFLTWSCLHHLSEQYGDLFRPTPELVERKETGETWYPPNHFRPLVDWPLDDDGQEELRTWMLGPLFQMTSLMLHERRSHLAHLNIIGELCAQFRRGILAVMRDLGPDGVIATVESYHRLHPESAAGCWFPETLDRMSSPAWQQLYVNAEHDGEVGVVTIGRESYNDDADRELNRALDWLVAEGIERLVVSGDFHLATQLVGADTGDFFPALENEAEGFRVSRDWSRTARRLADEFRISVGFIAGKRCLGGMLELLMHCHFLLAVEGAELGMPEVTLPVVPGMEGCHWPFRKTAPEDRPRLLRLLLDGRSIRAADAHGWLIDYSGPMAEALGMAWRVVTGSDHGLSARGVETAGLDETPEQPTDLPAADSPATETARRAIMECVAAACRVPLAVALEVQAKHSAGFMLTPECRRGRVGAEYEKTQLV
jgi:enoyl-CoA hydratase/carnithine racemase